MIGLRYAAPFAVFRDFTAGYFRSTFRFTSYSALYGLLLNIAGVEMRATLGQGPTLVKESLPSFEVASAVASRVSERHSFGFNEEQSVLPTSGVLFQQLHSLPVGSTNKHRIPLTKGNKHHISPGRRQLLIGLRGICFVKAEPEFEERLRVGLSGEPLEQERYGVPFLGDNSFMLEELEIIEPGQSGPVSWIVRDKEDDFDFFGNTGAGPTPFRLTIWADREGMSQTRSEFFVTEDGELNSPPESAWVRVGPVG